MKTVATQGFAPLGGGGRNALLARHSAFTLAEVLITLGIIGVVAVLTMPNLVADYQSRSYNTAASNFERKLGEALRVMNTQMTLAGHNSTEEFVDELSRHMKIVNVCKGDELLNCFDNKVMWGAAEATPEEIDMSVVKTSKNFGQKDWEKTNIVGVQFANGTNAMIAYNKGAKQDPFNNDTVTITGSASKSNGSVSLGTDALAILYDTNGFKSPNHNTKDLRSINVKSLGSNCFAEANGVCIAMEPQAPKPVSKAECEQLKAANYGIKWCTYDGDYWAGAVKLCGGKDKMASLEDLGKIAAYIYNKSSVGAEQNISYATLDKTKASKLGFTSTSFYIWSNKEGNGTTAYLRNFSNGTRINDYGRVTAGMLAVCISNDN